MTAPPTSVGKTGIQPAATYSPAISIANHSWSVRMMNSMTAVIAPAGTRLALPMT